MRAGARAHRSGCVVCGRALEYRAEAEPMRCATCDAAAPSAARCEAGHFVCDACHSRTAKDAIERFCLAADGTDPLRIARQLMRDPKLKLHGPEHHFLVAAALLAGARRPRAVGGPRCCKRTTSLALLAGVRFARAHLGVRMAGR